MTSYEWDADKGVFAQAQKATDRSAENTAKTAQAPSGNWFAIENLQEMPPRPRRKFAAGRALFGAFNQYGTYWKYLWHYVEIGCRVQGAGAGLTTNHTKSLGAD